MKIGVMQPYFLPYIGYFQLIGAVDLFVVFDNVEYTKKGWINRNRLLLNAGDALFSIPLTKDSDFLDVRDRQISDAFDRTKLLNRLAGAYRKAPHFERAFEQARSIVLHDESNLFKFIFNSIVRVCAYLGIHTKIVISSDIPIDHTALKRHNKVIALCRALEATQYINPIGGVKMYDKSAFERHSINLSFLESGNVRYKQFDHEFVPSLSIIDVMMFCGTEQIQPLLELYTLN